MKTLIIISFIAWMVGLFLAASVEAANLVPNSSFESGSTNWQMFGSSAIDTIRPGGQHGTMAMLLRTGTSLQGGPVTLTAGPHMFSFYGKVTSGLHGPYYAGIIASPSPDATAFGLSAGSFSNAWSRVVIPFTAPSNGNYYVKLINIQPDLLIDAVQLEAGPVTPYAPMGGTAPPIPPTPPTPIPASVRVIWDANVEAQVNGYRVLSGPAPRIYTATNTVTGRLNTNATVSSVFPGVLYLTVVAYADGQTSAFANEVTWTNGIAAPVRVRIVDP